MAGKIHGEVRTSGGIVPAQVCAQRVAPTVALVAADVDPICTSTDATGRFVLALGSGVFFVVASADHHEPRGEQVVVVASEPGPSVDFELLPGGRFYAGTVVDIEGQPIPGAKITHEVDLGLRHGGVEVQANAQGEFRLWSSRKGRLRVRAPGYMRMLIATPDDLRLVLLPESSIEGTVVDRSGQPVAHARVSVSDELGSAAWGWPEDAVWSDERGRFRLTQLGPGIHVVVAFAEPNRDFGAGLRVDVEFAEHREDIVVMLDDPLLQYRAQFVDAESGAPVAGCEITVTTRSKYDPTALVWADEAGLLELPFAVKPELHAIQCPGYVASMPFRQLSPDLSSPTRIEVRRGHVFEGTLVDTEWRPISGRRVALRVAFGRRDKVYWPPADITDASGRFTFDGLPEGDYTFETAGYIDHRHLVRVGEEGSETFEVPAAERVEIEFPASAIGRSLVLIDCEHAEPDESVYPYHAASIESDRLAVFERSSPGTYHVSFHWEFGQTGDVACRESEGSITVALGETTRVRLDPGPLDEVDDDLLAIRVLDPAGAPVAGAVVSQHMHDDPVDPREWSLDPSSFALTDADGRTVIARDHHHRYYETGIVVAVRPGFHGTRKVRARSGRMQHVTVRLQPVAPVTAQP